MNPGFLIGKSVGDNLAPFAQRSREQSIIDRILNQTQQAQGQQDYQSTINDILRAQLSQPTQQSLMGAVQNRQQQQAASGLFGEQFAGLNPDLQKAYLTAKGTQAQNAPGKEFAKAREKAIADYYGDLSEDAQKAQNMEVSLSNVEAAVQSGNIEGPGFTALAKSNPYTAILVGLNPDEQILTSSNKALLEGTKGLFGSKPTEREIFTLLQGMLPAIGKSKEANLAGVAVIREMNNLKILRNELAQQITENGTKYVPNLEAQINQAMNPYIDQFRDSLKQQQAIQNKQQKEGKQAPKSPSDALIEQARKSRQSS